MWSQIKSGSFSVIFALIFSFILFFNNNSEAQSLWKINSNNPGTQPSNTSTSSNSSVSKGALIVAGVVIVGVVVYTVFIDKGDDDSDSTKSDSSSLLSPLKNKNKSLTARVAEKQSEIPVDIYLGIKNDNYINRERTYVVGVSWNF